MWATNNRGNDILNEKGQPIRLFVPSFYQGGETRGIGRRQDTDWSISTIGGPGTIDHQVCSQCPQPLVQLLQFAIPNNNNNKYSNPDATRESWVIQACNSSSCFSKIFQGEPGSAKKHDGSQQFAIGGKGIVVCQKVDFSTVALSSQDVTVKEEMVDRKSEDAACDDKDVNDWEMSPEEEESGTAMADEDDGLDDLEEKLASIETTSASIDITKKTKRKLQSNHSYQSQSLVGSNTNGDNIIDELTADHHLPCFKLSEVRESPAARPSVAVSDPDDVGLSTDSQDHIQRMLQKYMEEEEDMALVQMLQQEQENSEFFEGDPFSSSKKSLKGQNNELGEEEDEPLSSAERTLYQYLDRLKRLPSQVVRCAPGGVLMWSIPEPSSGLQIPQCSSCGKDRVFQFQVLPQILHVLHVDGHAATSSKAAGAATDGTRNKKEHSSESLEIKTGDEVGGGMDFGNLCLYVCCDRDTGKCNDDGLIVVQASVEEAEEETEMVESMYSSRLRHRSQERNVYDQTAPVVVHTEKGDASLPTTVGDDDDDEWTPDAS